MASHADSEAYVLSLFEKYVAGDVSFRADFDAVLSERLTPELLSTSWDQVVSAAGEFRNFGSPQSRAMDDGTLVIDIPMFFERAQLKARAALDKERRVAGWFVLTPDAS